jgi:8-oxo-dGTP diphosphatase
MLPHKFNIRVYALVIKDKKVLLVTEQIKDFVFTKFPGGGVELGEGIVDALQREIKEELDTTITKHTHFYTTEFFQVSAFNAQEQIISIYYMVQLENYPAEGKITLEPNHRLQFHWKPLEELSIEEVTFPIDKCVIHILMADKESF